MATPTDAELIDACRRGNDAAWATLVERYAGLVRSIPRRYRFSDADADDVMQATFLALHRSIERIDDGQALPKWLMTTAHREAWRIGRDRDVPLDPGGDFHNVHHPQDDVLALGEERSLIRRAIEDLGGRCRELLERLYAPDRSPYDVLAQDLDMPIGSIGPTRARCLDKLRTIAEGLGLGDHESAG
jgi:RNA polymerase sigma factor (sigma-70 family)